MTWYGLLTFHLNGPSATLQTRQALLLVRALTGTPGLLALWSAVFDPITEWVGRSDDLTVRDYSAVMARVYPANAPLSALGSDTRLARFMALARALPGPQIDGELLTPGQNATKVGKGLRRRLGGWAPLAGARRGLLVLRVPLAAGQPPNR